MPAETIVQRFHERVRSHPDKVALRYKDAGRWRVLTWRDYGESVTAAAKGLMAAGLARGDKMSLLSSNRPEWHIADVACMAVGGCTAPIYATSSPEQVAYIIGHSESTVAVVENRAQLDKVLEERASLPALDKVVIIEGYDDADPDFVMPWGRLLEAQDARWDAAYDDAVAAHSPSDVATFVYTSGTTGPPKAVVLTHDNVWWTAVRTQRVIDLGTIPAARTLSYLPLSHIAERMISHFLQIYYASETWFAQSIETLRDDILECKPTYFFGVPRVWEKIYAVIRERLDAADPSSVKTKLARRALAVGRRVAEAEQAAVARGGKLSDARLSPLLRAEHGLLDKVVLHKVRDAIGLGECRLALSAAAPLNPEVIWFFSAIGIKIIEIYGQSEDTGPTSINPPEATRIGSVGKVLPGAEIKIADDGEILVRGGNVTQGYYKDSGATAELLDADGWMRSGDVGHLDDHGYLYITDRKKDLIITAGGKNAAPQEIENRIKLHPLVSQAVVIGDNRPYLTALVCLDEDKIVGWARAHGIDGTYAEIAANDRVLKEIESVLDEVNRSLSKVERIKKFRVLERDLSQEQGELTPTLKVKRKEVGRIYAAAIEDMYRDGSPSAAAAPPRSTE